MGYAVMGDQALLAELTRVKALFQARTIATILGADADGIRIVDGNIVERLKFVPVSQPLDQISDQLADTDGFKAPGFNHASTSIPGAQ